MLMNEAVGTDACYYVFFILFLLVFQLYDHKYRYNRYNRCRKKVTPKLTVYKTQGYDRRQINEEHLKYIKGQSDLPGTDGGSDFL